MQGVWVPSLVGTKLPRACRAANPRATAPEPRRHSWRVCAARGDPTRCKEGAAAATQTPRSQMHNTYLANQYKVAQQNCAEAPHSIPEDLWPHLQFNVTEGGSELRCDQSGFMCGQELGRKIETIFLLCACETVIKEKRLEARQRRGSVM